MHHYKLVIFDWDGTLMDSVDRIVSSMQNAAQLASLNVPSKLQAKQIIGLSMPKVVETLFPRCSKEQETLLIKHYKQQYIELNHVPTNLFDNALVLLEALQAKDKLLAVATGKGRGGLDRVMAETNTTQYFHATRCADEAFSKPHPQMLLSLLEELRLSPSEALMIGDTSHDLKMAQHAGVDSIGVTYGVHDKQILSQYQPKAVVNSLFELESLLIK